MEKLKERLRHALLAFLLSVGLSMPLCGALDETLISPRILVMIAGNNPKIRSFLDGIGKKAKKEGAGNE